MNTTLLKKFGEKIVYGFGFGLGMGFSFKIYYPKNKKDLSK